MLRETSTSHLTEPVKFESKGHATFARAIDYASTVGYEPDEIHAFIRIGNCLADCGIDPSEIIVRLQDLYNLPTQTFRDEINRGLAAIEMSHGNFPGVDRIVKRAPHLSGKLAFNIGLALYKARYGADPANDLALADACVQKYPTIEDYAELATAYHQITGEYPEGYLAKAQKMTEVYGHDFEGDTYHSHLPLGKAYASCGNMEQAIKLYKEMEGKDPDPVWQVESQALLLQNVAKKYMERGRFGEAVTQIDIALRLLEDSLQLDFHWNFIKNCDPSILLALKGQAQAGLGEDPTTTFDQAVKMIPRYHEQTSPLWRMPMFIAIAKAQHAAGKDPIYVYSMALKEINEVPQHPDYNPFYDDAYQLCSYQDLANIQAKTGHIDQARVTLSSIHNMKTDISINQSVAEVMADIAAAEVRGLN